MKENQEKVLDMDNMTVLTRNMDAKELRRLLTRAKISQAELAARVGVTPGAISYWLSGRRKMHPVFGKVIREVIQKKRVA